MGNALAADVVTRVATRREYNEVIRNLRPYDAEEMKRSGYTRKNLLRMFDLGPDQPRWMVGLYRGKPVCVFGHHFTPWLCYFMFLGTPDIDTKMKLFTRYARTYIGNVCDSYPDYRAVVAVWEGHTDSRDWLRILGFNETGAVLWRANNRFLLVERR